MTNHILDLLIFVLDEKFPKSQIGQIPNLYYYTILLLSILLLSCNTYTICTIILLYIYTLLLLLARSRGCRWLASWPHPLAELLVELPIELLVEGTTCILTFNYIGSPTIIQTLIYSKYYNVDMP